MKQAVKEAPVLAEHGANQHGDKSGVGDTKSSSKGTNATYLTARLKRDAPDIATRLERGEFKSVRAAAIEAGIVNAPKTAVAPILAGFSTGPDQSPEIFFLGKFGAATTMGVAAQCRSAWSISRPPGKQYGERIATAAAAGIGAALHATTTSRAFTASTSNPAQLR